MHLLHNHEIVFSLSNHQQSNHHMDQAHVPQCWISSLNSWAPLDEGYRTQNYTPSTFGMMDEFLWLKVSSLPHLFLVHRMKHHCMKAPTLLVPIFVVLDNDCQIVSTTYLHKYNARKNKNKNKLQISLVGVCFLCQLIGLFLAFDLLVG